MSVLFEWRIQAIEHKADEANRRLYEIDSLRSDVGRLERALGEFRTECDGLRYELQDALRRIEHVESMIAEIAPWPTP